MTREEIFDIRCRDRAIELYHMVKALLELPDIPPDLAFQASRLLARIDRIPGEGDSLTAHT